MRSFLFFIGLSLGIFVHEDDTIYSNFLDLEEIEVELSKLVDPLQNPNVEQFSFSLEKFEFFTAERREIPVVVIEPIGQVTTGSVVVVCGADGSNFGAVTACLNIAKDPNFYGFTRGDMSNGFSSAVKLIVIPVLNPDGYNYARKSDRLWKKNRSPTDNLICPGVNLDRNSPFKHESLSDACSEDFGGASPLSENELRGLSEYLSRAGPVLSFLSVSEKAFGEDGTNVFYSSALDTSDRQSSDRHEIFLAEKIANAALRISTSGNLYRAGQLPPQYTSGSLLEWAKSESGLNIGFCYEMSLSNGEAKEDDELQRSIGLELLSATEIIWKNADKRATFETTPLDDYVWRKDDAYSWEQVEGAFFEDDWTISYVINSTSQVWLNSTILNEYVWWHLNVVILPKTFAYTDAAILLVVGWDNKDRDPADALTRSDTNRARSYVASSGIPVVLNYQTPNQPIFFVDDPLEAIYPNGRKEDAIIARTWHMFTDDPSFVDVPVRLPMTKAAIRAMDTAEDFMTQKNIKKPVRWGITGASKRAWTTWCAAAVDYERIVWQAPVWMDLLDLVPSVKHHFRSLGGWTYNYFDYYVEGFTMNIDEPVYDELAAIVDPFVYLDRYSKSTMTVVMNAGNDEFFLPSDMYFFWDDLFGDKFMKVFPNKGHGGVGYNVREDRYTGPELENIVWRAIDGLFEEFLSPTFTKKRNGYQPWTWKLWNEDGYSGIEFFSSVPISTTRAWLSYSAVPDRRDWRKSGLTEYLCPKDYSEDIDFDDYWHLMNTTYYEISDEIVFNHFPSEEFEFKYALNLTDPAPGEKFTTFFLEFEINSEVGSPITFTTEANIAPMVYPYEECEGAACLGCFI